MVNSKDLPVFVDSTLKVTAKEDIDLNKELAQENTQNTTIDELLVIQNNDKIKE